MKLIVPLWIYDHGLTVKLSLGVGDMAHGCHPTYVSSNARCSWLMHIKKRNPTGYGRLGTRESIAGAWNQGFVWIVHFNINKFWQAVRECGATANVPQINRLKKEKRLTIPTMINMYLFSRLSLSFTQSANQPINAAPLFHLHNKESIKTTT